MWMKKIFLNFDFNFRFHLKTWFNNINRGFTPDFSKMESQEVKQMFSYFDYLLKQLLIEKYPNTSNDYSDLDCINEKIITEEYRKFLDKVAIRMTTDMFEREEYVNAILKLARMERIIIAFNIIQGIELREIAYLLNTSADSVYSQKNTALKRLKAELSNIK